jgi:hypothetical protein
VASDLVHSLPSEDLRNPVAADNALDDETLKDAIDKENLENIFDRILVVALRVAEEAEGEQLEQMQRYYGYVTSVKEQDEGVALNTVESNGYHYEDEKDSGEYSADGDELDPSVPLESTEAVDDMDIDG